METSSIQSNTVKHPSTRERPVTKVALKSHLDEAAMRGHRGSKDSPIVTLFVFVIVDVP